jgi:hypothetical protein
MNNHRNHPTGTGAVALFLGLLLGSLTGCERPATPGPAASPTSSAPSPTAAASASASGPAAKGAGLGTVQPPIPAGATDLFEDVTGRAGLGFVHQLCDDHVSNIIESNGAGGAILDFDGDGWVDIFLVNSGPLEGVTKSGPGVVREPNRLYRNRGDGTFEDVTARAGVAGSGYGTAATAGDYDNDGRPDLYVACVGKNQLYRNRGDGTFEDVTDRAKVGDAGTGIGAVFVDVDQDGRLDLFVANYLTFDPKYRLYFQPDGFPNALAYKPEFNVLYRNRGDGTFEDVSESSGIRIAGHRAMSVTSGDLDLDGDMDFYLSNDLSANLLLLNDGKGRFAEVGAKVGVAFNALGEAAGSMGATVGDANGDGRPDLLVTRFGYGSLYLGTPQGIFADHMMASGLGAITAQFVAWGGAFFDFDNDRDEDVFIANGDAHYLVGWQSLLLENRGDGTFEDAATKGGAVFQAKLRGRAAATLDFDNDGRVDLLMTSLADRPLLLRNRAPAGAHWLLVRLQGTRSNRDGYGSRLRVTAGGRTTLHQARAATSFLMQSDPRVSIGLGAADRVSELEIRWPSGQVQVLKDVPADQVLTVTEPAGER